MEKRTELNTPLMRYIRRVDGTAKILIPAGGRKALIVAGAERTADGRTVVSDLTRGSKEEIVSLLKLLLTHPQLQEAWARAIAELQAAREEAG